MASTWSTAQSGSWNASANWSNGIPNAANAVANFTTLGTVVSPWSIDLGGATDTVGTLNVSASSIEHYDFDNGVLAMQISPVMRGSMAFINVTSANTSSFSALDASLTLDLLTNTEIDNLTSGVFDVAAKITGAGDLVATGAGTVRIDNSSNNWTGGLIIEGGTVLALNTNVLAGGLLEMTSTSTTLDLDGHSQTVGNLYGDGLIQTFAGSATLTVNETTATTFSGTFEDGSFGAISGVALNLTKTGAATLTLSGANYTQGVTTINQGTIALGSDDALSFVGSVAVGAGATLDLNGFDTQIISISGAGSVVNSGSGAHYLQLTGASNFAGVISGAVNIQLDHAFTSLTLSGANTYTGTTLLLDGSTLTAGASGAFSTASAYDVESTSTINLNGFNETIAKLSGSGEITNGAGGTSSVLTFDNSGVTIDSVAIVNGASGGVIGLDVSGGGQLVLAGANTYSGGTTVEAGVTLVAGADDAFSANSVIDIASGGAVDLAGYDEAVGGLAGSGSVTSSLAGNVTLTVGSSSYAGAITDGSGVISLTVAPGAAFHLSGSSNAYTGATSIGAGSTLYGDGFDALSADSVINLSSTGELLLSDYDQAIGGLTGSGMIGNVGYGYVTLTVDEAVASTFSGEFNSGSSGSGVNLIKTGAATLTLSGDNIDAGDMTVAAGTLAGGASSAFTTTGSVLVAKTGTLDIGGFNQTIGNLDDGSGGGGKVTNNGAAAATLTVGGAASNFSGVIKDGSAAIGLSLAANAVVGLSGKNTYSGLTKIGAGAELYAGAANTLSAASALTIGLSGVLDLEGYNQTIGALSGSGEITNSASSPSSAVLTTKTSGSTTYSGAIVDGASGGLVRLSVTGAGTLVLSGANTYSGTTTIANGATLAAGANNAFSANSLVKVSAGATLNVQSFNETIGGLTDPGSIIGSGSLTVTGKSTISGGTNLAVAALVESGATSTLSIGALTYAGALTEQAGTLTLPGALTLTGTNSLSGKIVGAGELSIAGGSTTINTGATVSVAKILVNGSSASLTFGAIHYAGALTQKSGTITLTDTLTLTGTNALTGSIGGSGELAITGGATTIHAAPTLSVASLLVSGTSTNVTFGALSYAGALTENSGTITLLGALTLTGTNVLNGAIAGAGQLSVTGGTTTLHNAASLTMAKLLISGASTTLSVGTASYAGALTEQSGTLQLTGTLTETGTASLTGAVTGAGALAIAGGATTIHAGTTLSMSSWSILGAATDVTLSEAATYAGTFSLAAGTLDLTAGTLQLSGDDNFTGGTITGDEILLTEGTLTTVSGLTIGGTVEWENAATLTQTGTVTIGGSSGTAFLDNTSTGVYDLLANADINQGASATSYIANAGTLEKTSGGAVSTIAPAVTNTGTIKVTVGTLDLEGAVTGTGADTISGASTLEFDSTVAAGQSITFAGSGGVLDLGSPQNFAGVIKHFDLSGGTNDAIELVSGWSFTGATETATKTTLAFADGGTHASLTLQGDYTGSFSSTTIAGGIKITYA